ncbi:hypothetical protein IB275_30490 [Pseudomonas sp. PDM21]|uniref:hypothetical protein n=1 Tax=Pseudomonas sp. PDM21 TaxID=2769257 RepID=UPI00177FFF57|nr:hypothetical protein [Pseudomonas sp. PDM21]MBD9674945.1 hypothetical protein [Pseudomonas sp. PDM21]
MPYYGNGLYSRGVPTYAEELSPLADIFKALQPNPLRDLQIQGYLAKTDLDRIKATAARNQQEGLGPIADQFAAGNLQGGYENAIRSGNTALLKELPAVTRGYYAAGPEVDQGRLANLMLGAGGNYANTQPGFEADQQRLLDIADQQSADRRYGTDVGASTTMRGQDISAATQRRGQDLGNEQAIYRANVGLLSPRSGSGGSGAGASVGKPPTINGPLMKQLDAAIWQFIPEGFDPAGPDLADASARAGQYMRDPSSDAFGNPALAAQLAAHDVWGAEPKTEGNWSPAANVVVGIPPDQRPAMPQGNSSTGGSVRVGAGGAAALSPLAQQLLQGGVDLRRPIDAKSLQPAAPAPAPAPAAPAAAPAGGDILAQAQDAIARGAPRDAVIQRLRAAGVGDAQISAAGL